MDSEKRHRRPAMTLAATLHASSLRHPARPALVAPEGTVTLAELDRLARGVAALIDPGQTVALAADNGLALVVAFLGALYAGAAVAPVHAGTPAVELARRGLRPLDPDALLMAATAPLAAPRAVAGEAPALVLQTSGTTGEPRAVVVTEASLHRHTAQVAEVLGLGPDDRVLGVLPLAHSFGCRMALLAPLVAGATVHIGHSRFSARASLALMEAAGITWVPAVPTMYAAWAAVAGPPPGRLRWCLSAGAPLADAVRRAAEERLGCEVRQGYGLSEASFATLDAPPAARVAGSVGRPVPGVEVRLEVPEGGGGTGEIFVRGSNLMAGYARPGVPDLDAGIDAAGWLATGDLGRFEGDCLVVVERVKDVVLVGGHTVHPAEVEAVLAACHGVRAVAVVGRADAFLGEVLTACVVGDVDFNDLRDFACERLTPWKVPRRFERLDALPIGPSGKVLRRALRVAPEAPGA